MKKFHCSNKKVRAVQIIERSTSVSVLYSKIIGTFKALDTAPSFPLNPFNLQMRVYTYVDFTHASSRTVSQTRESLVNCYQKLSQRDKKFNPSCIIKSPSQPSKLPQIKKIK